MLTPLEIEAVSLSLWVASWSTLTVLPLAIVAALILARAEFWGKSLFDGIIHLPLVLPPVVIGYLLLITLGTRGLDRVMAAGNLRHPPDLHIDRRFGRGRRHVVPADGAGDPAGDRGDRQRA